MQRAASHFVGTHDFAAVRSVGTETRTTVRTVHYFNISRSGELIECRVCADGFLYNMVRAMVGTVVYAAEGKLAPEDIPAILDAIREDPLLDGVTLSGGEPFCQAEALLPLVREVKKMGKTVFAYSGYTLEQLLELGKTYPAVLELLKLCDTLVDGPYVEALRNLDLEFRGSSNQRIIDLHTIF